MKTFYIILHWVHRWMESNMNIKQRWQRWIMGWFNISVGIMCVITLTLWRPSWDLSYTYRFLSRNLLEFNRRTKDADCDIEETCGI